MVHSLVSCFVTLDKQILHSWLEIDSADYRGFEGAMNSGGIIARVAAARGCRGARRVHASRRGMKAFPSISAEFSSIFQRQA